MATNPNFGDTAFEGTIAPETPIVQPVVDQSTESFATGLANGLGAVNDIFSASQQNNARKNSKISGSLAADITERIGQYADAVDQGSLDRTRALSRLRADINKWMSDNPGQEAFIQEYINKNIGTTGIAPELAEDTPEEKAKKAVLEEANKFGWSFDPNNTPEQNINIYTKHKRDLQAVEDIGTQISLQEGQGKIISSQLKVKATSALHSAMDSGLPWVQGTIDQGFKALEGVTDPAQRAAVIADVETKITQQTAIVDDLRSKSDNAIDTSYMTQSYKDLLSNFKDVANGKATMDQYKNVSDLEQAKLGAMISMDPSLSAALATSKMLGFASGANLDLITAGTTRLIDQMRKSGGPTVPGDVPPQTADVVGDTPDIADTFNLLSGEFKGINSDPSKATPEIVNEANSTLIGAFKSVARHSTAGMDPRELNQFMQFMADPNTGAYIETHMKDIAPSVASDARQIVEQNYNDVGINLINERWASTHIQFGGQVTYFANSSNTTDTKDAIKPVWNGSGIEFQVDPKFKDSAIVQNQAKSLNSDVAGPLNNMVRASAHMQGTRDYTKVYNDQFAKRLWVAGGDVPGDITDLKVDAPTVVSPSYLKAIAGQESGGDNNAKNPNSSATGKYQFTSGTWATLSANHPGLGLTPDGRTNEAQQDKAIVAFTADNASALKAAGIPSSNPNLYAAHFLGTQDAVEVLNADDGDMVSDYVSPRVIKANPQLGGMTVGQFKAWTKKVIK